MTAWQRAEARAAELAQLERLLASDDAPMRVAEIAHRMAVSRRTVLRRMVELEDSGLAVRFVRAASRGAGGWILERVWRARISVSEGEG